MSGVVRDRLTWMVYLQIGMWGFFLYGFGPTVPLLRDELGVSRAVGGLHATMLAVGAITTGLTGSWLVARFGRGRLLWAGVAGVAVGATGYCAAPVVLLTLASALLIGLAGSLIVNCANAVLMDHQGPAGPAALSEANATAGATGIVAPLVVGGAVGVGVGWRAGVMVTVVLAVALYAAFRTVRVPPSPPVHADDHPDGVRTLPRRYWITWCVVVCTIGVEFCLSLWASDLLHSRTGISAGLATAAWSGLLVGMTVSRVLGGRLVVHRPVDTVLAGALAVLLLGFSLFWATTVPWLAMAGLVVAGLGLGVQYPLGVGRAIGAAAGRSDLASTRLSLAAGLASGLMPFLLGAMADRWGVHTAFLLVPVLVVLAGLGLAVSRPGLPGEAQRPSGRPAASPGAA